MSKLILKEFRCIEESDEADSDSPYFVIFVGRPGSTPTSDVLTLRRESWDNTTDAGDVKPADLLVANDVGPGTVVLAALMEEDGDADINFATLDAVRKTMQPLFLGFAAFGSSVSQISSKMQPEFVSALNKHRGGDELIAVRRVEIPSSPGKLPLINYKGDGAEYEVRFTVR